MFCFVSHASLRKKNQTFNKEMQENIDQRHKAERAFKTPEEQKIIDAKYAKEKAEINKITQNFDAGLDDIQNNIEEYKKTQRLKGILGLLLFILLAGCLFCNQQKLKIQEKQLIKNN